MTPRITALAQNSVAALPNTALMLGVGLLGAVPADLAGLPMPYLMGALASVGVYSAARTRFGLSDAWFSKPLRQFFVAMIGVMIGASFSSALLGNIGALWPSLGVMVLFVIVSLGAGYTLFRYGAGYDRVTSFYAAMPGGLIEAVSLGEAAGGDVKALALQHFSRIVWVVVAVPLLYLMWSGDAVGSAGGQSFDGAGWGLLDILELTLLALVGMWIGPKLRLPAAHLVGPLVLSAALHATDVLHVASPGWLLAVAQLVVGSGLAVSFAGTRLPDLVRAFALGGVYVGVTLGFAFGIAVGLSQVLPFDFDTVFVSFAPGGVTEMGLIALSLGISPLVVTAHHIFRIALTVLIAALTVGRV